ncbi:hypothetical protein CJF42_21565 [Pseudoalteromonas sp. NBT06-2]|uniref:hypothetical protein n=1 Tax=Pseudoalteromonas sp. NBT06-2 TaxID=2025950 RepID=UPI000BA56091|nr:hypothetical protein [Pseudoalteromonas sp. NBT06-2]PAJ72371.1 hypothetical protein CJF42_21565 [Pseudoalteromonas sp. NBT06-2]
MFAFVQNKVLQLSSATTALGIAVIFSYCFFIIKFFPSELSLGETLLFLFAGLGFGIFYSLIIGLFYASTAHIISVLKNKTYLSEISTSLLSLFFLISPIVISIVFNASMESWQALISFYASGFILNFESITKDKQLIFPAGDITKEEDHKKIKVLILAIGVLTPIFMSNLASSNLLKSTFTNLGIRTEKATLLVNNANLKVLMDLSKSQGIAIFNCKSNQYSTLENITVDWHGIGSTTQIRLDSTNKEEIIIPLDSNGVKVIKGLVGSQKPRCFLLKKNIYFDSGDIEPNENGNSDLSKIIADIKDKTKHKNLKLKELFLNGYTDIQPFKQKGSTNFELAKQRIEAVKLKLQPHLESNVEVKLTPLGIYKKNKAKNNFCSNIQYKKYEKPCLSYDRFVEITVKFEKVE